MPDTIATLPTLRPGARVMVLVTRVGAQGTSRWMRVIASADNEPVDITWSVAGLLGLRMMGDDIYIRGAGMDMRMKVLMDLSRALFGEDYALHLA